MVILCTHDLDGLRNFYQNTFGVGFEKHTDHGPKHYGAQFGNVYLEIYLTSQELRQLDGLGFEVDNLESFLKAVDKDFIYKEIQSTPSGRFATIKHTDSRLIYLREK